MYTNKSKKAVIYAAVGIIAIILLIYVVRAFAPEDGKTSGDDIMQIGQSVQTDGTLGAANNTADDTGTQMNDAAERYTHVYKEYSELFVMDADIAQNTPKTAEVLLAKDRTFDEQLLVKMFFRGGDANITHDEPFKETSIEDGNGSYLFMEPNTIRYSNAAKKRVKFPTENFSTKYTGIMMPGGYLPMINTVYDKESLSFMTPEEAILAAKDYLNKLSVTVDETVEIYAVDHDTMQSYQDKLKVTDADSVQNYDITDTLTDEDDFYVICFRVKEHELTVTHRLYENAVSGRTLDPAYVEIHMNKNGITWLDMGGIRTIQGVERTADILISAEAAVEKVYEFYNSFVYTQKVIVTEVELEYVPVPYNGNSDEVKLVPAWDVTVRIDVDGMQIYQQYSVDAASGELIR